ncbi:MAG: hypothetical protein K2J11_06890 [Oscillospiraceae bacterium]|nr:hypothetical protein [Oscillospiraceae bacterium]
MAIMLSLNMSLDEQQTILRKYGYCLSKSVAADMVVKWFVDTYANAGGEILPEVNEVLDGMGLPLLMTRIKG